MSTQYTTQPVLPWQEAVTLTSVRDAGNVASGTLYAGVYQITIREAGASGGVYTTADKRFTLDTAAVTAANITPKPGDRVSYGGESWTVLEVSGSRWLKFWSLTARNLVLAADLRSVCEVLRATNAQDDAGFRSVTRAAVYEDVPCRLQEVASEFGTDYDGATHRREYTLIVGERLYLQAQDVIQVGDDKYDILGTGSWDRIDQLGEVRVRRVEA